MPTIHPIDFASTELKQYGDFYAVDFLTPAECKALRELASSTGEWKPAGLSVERETETVHSSFRNSDYVIRVDEEVASMIYERLRLLVPEIHLISPNGEWGNITRKPGKNEKNMRPTWKVVRVNPRLNGLNELLDGTTQKSFVTLHLYLTGGVSGGSTRFWTPDKKHFLDVDPRVGRVLVFQQRTLVHSEEEVMDGIIYTMRSDFIFEQEV
ncbi:hypothetical protein C8J57DRAFT_1314597 [Mycena rebaudengoi]|nr:hypothetical protein C8J57DRAFT_1314597 [Mycena rebaudengoi]